MKTAELTGAALDWAVSSIEGWDKSMDASHSKEWFRLHRPKYSTDWSEAGPIIEREKLQIWKGGEWCAALENEDGTLEFGPTPLIAAMRCYVASRLGSEIEIPEELT